MNVVVRTMQVKVRILRKIQLKRNNETMRTDELTSSHFIYFVFISFYFVFGTVFWFLILFILHYIVQVASTTYSEYSISLGSGQTYGTVGLCDCVTVGKETTKCHQVNLCKYVLFNFSTTVLTTVV